MPFLGWSSMAVGSSPLSMSGIVLRHPLVLLCLLLLLPLGASALAEVSTLDDDGRRIELQAPAQRIVSLAPHTTELLFAAGAGKQVVAAVEHSDYPPEARQLPRVGRASALDLERILALRPDLVVAWQSGSSPAQIARLQALGVPVFLSEPRTLADIPASLRRLGELAGTRAVADVEAQAFEARLAELRRRYGGRRSLRGFYQIWPEPLMTVSGEHLISRVMALCGVENIFAGLPTLAPQVSLEAVLEANPEIILASGELPGEWTQPWQRWKQLAAVRAGNLFYIDPDLIHRHTPRVLDGAEVLCEYAEAARGKP